MQEPNQETEIDMSAFQKHVVNSIDSILFTESLQPTDIRPFSAGFELSKKEAEDQIARLDVKQVICRALQSLTDDVYDIAKEITLPLVAAAISGSVVTPMLIAWIALLISRAGIKAYCPDNGN